MEAEKHCENCYYFFKHYTNANGRFMPVNCGHCTNGDLTKGEKTRHTKKLQACEFWKPQEEQIAERKEKIEIRLINMAKSIEEIADILKNE